MRLSVVANGSIALRLTDHPEPSVHSGYSMHFGPARELANALIGGRSIRVPTLEGRMLAFDGITLGDEAVWERAWTLDESERVDLGRALIEGAR